MAECFNSLTYRPGLPPREAREAMGKNLKRFRFVMLDGQDYQAAIDRVIEQGMTGDKIYGALHVRGAIKDKAEKNLHVKHQRFFPADQHPD
ncbi:MAG: hypothetical protein ACREFR_06055 [Limisphaerales bacterium]